MMTADDPLAGWATTDDPKILTALVRRHSDAVHVYLARRGGHQVADDPLGEVWLRALRSRESYDSSWSDPRPWLYGIARNVMNAHWRLRSHEAQPAQELVVDPWAEVDAGLDAARLRPALLAALDRSRHILQRHLDTLLSPDCPQEV